MWVNAMDPMIVGKGVNSNFRGAEPKKSKPSKLCQLVGSRDPCSKDHPAYAWVCSAGLLG